jgi:hypothetical protein
MGLLSAYLSEGNSKGVLGETKGDIGPTTRTRPVHEELLSKTLHRIQPSQRKIKILSIFS